ncbi:MAG TPA: DUF2975 domain-containing protein [Nocardioidaceae bacterium]|nr:DUF2975 domain-containing protein [Nocardioidaceae bacterium]
MASLTVRALRGVLVVLLAGSVLLQTGLVILLAIGQDDPDDLAAYQLTLARVITILGIVTIQIVLACVWRLVTMVRRGTVFSHAAFRYVHIVTGAIVAAAVLMFAFAVVLAPGEAVPPGMILLMGGVVVAILGVALVVLVLRMLLAQAVARDVEATQMRAELEDVI